MKAIDQALLQYRNANGRLPCPADLPWPRVRANYGVESESRYVHGRHTAGNFKHDSWIRV